MADPFGIIGVVSLTMQIIQIVVQFGLDWKEAPRDVKSFLTQVQTLRTVLSETNTNLLLNSDFAEAFQNPPSLLLSQLGPNAPPTTDAKIMLRMCEKELKELLKELEKRAKGHQVGWERLKGAFLARNTRESVENLYRHCQTLNSMISIDTAILGATTYKEVKEARKEQHEARKENQKWHYHKTSREILAWLASFDYGDQQSDFLNRREKGTGQWLLNSPEFQNWCNEGRNTLFCPGMPGAGKTIMASIVVDHLYTKFRDHNIGIAYLFCNFRRQEEQKPADLLASLLKQLLLGLPDIPDSLRRLYEYHNDKQTRPSFDEISKELHSVVGNYSKCFFIVDALDEVSDGGRKKFLSEMFDLQARIGVNLFATSRFIPEITKQCAGNSALLEIRASDEDVQRYLNGQMTRLPSFVQRSLDVQEEIKAEIVKAVKGMFLLAQLHLDSLVGSKSTKTLRKALQRLPKGSDAYDHAYDEAINRIKGQIANFRDLAMQVLSWITCAKRPLTTLELQHALAIEVGESELDKDNIPEIEDMVSVCAGLVTVDEESNIIRLVHYTTQEYFERAWISVFPNAQEDIANSCVIYLSFSRFEAGFCLTDKDFEERLELNPFYEYAARNWGHHVNAASTNVQHSIPEFLENEAKVSCCSQALMVPNEYHYDHYSQLVPTRVTGVHLAAYFGLRETTLALLENRHQPDIKDSRNQTPLSWAAANGHNTVVSLLLARVDVEADSKDVNGHTSLSRAAVKGHETVVGLLLTRADVKADSKTIERWTPLLRAAAKGHETVVGILLARADVEADSKDINGQTPLSWAARNGHETIVGILLTRADVEADSKDINGRTPLWWAVANGRETVIGILITRADVEANSKDTDGRTPLSWAAANGHETVVRILIARADVEAGSKDTDGRTPLSLAAANGHKMVVGILLARADVETDSKDIYSRTPLSWAAANGHETVVRILIARADVEADSKDIGGRIPLWWAVANGHEAVIKLLLDRAGVELNSKDEYGTTALSWAAKNGHSAIVRLLLDRADVEADSKDTNGCTPLSTATINGHEAVTKLLLDRTGVEVNSKDKFGQTPLSWAAEKGHDAIIRLLLDRADVEADSKDEYGQTPLSWAAAKGHEAVVKLLLARADVEADSKDTFNGQTPLSWSAGNGHETVVRLLLARADVEANSKDKYDQTPLTWAASNGRETVVKLLLATDGVDPDSKDYSGRTPLWWAAKNGQAAVVEMLLATKADMNSTDLKGRSPLSLAAKNGHDRVVSLLLENNADFHAKDNCGRTALQLATFEGHKDVEQLLLKKGASQPEDSYGLHDLFLSEEL